MMRSHDDATVYTDRTTTRLCKKEGKTHVEILSEFEDAWILEDAEWAAAVGSKDALLKGLEASEEGRLVQVTINGNRKLTSLPESVGECTALQTLDLQHCSGLVSLPERLGECPGLQELYLGGCRGLVSLPERLGECTALQALNLHSCSGLVSLPDLSGLALKVYDLPDRLQPWKASGHKAFSLSNEG